VLEKIIESGKLKTINIGLTEPIELSEGIVA
jgi:hypothetical protein